jgi:hypothetical protein
MPNFPLGITFQREMLSDVLEEITPLLFLHWKEIAHFKDIQLSPDWNRYFEIERNGCLRVFTARDIDKTLIGYAVFFAPVNLHYKEWNQATQDILFIHPEKRGFGASFIQWCDEMLRAEGMKLSFHHVKKAHNFGPMLESMGYELVDLIYARRLDKMGEK